MEHVMREKTATYRAMLTRAGFSTEDQLFEAAQAAEGDRALSLVTRMLVAAFMDLESAERQTAEALAKVQRAAGHEAEHLATGQAFNSTWITGHVDRLDQHAEQMHAAINEIVRLSQIRQALLSAPVEA